MTNNKKHKKHKKHKINQLPFVSICTPTFNRRPFINAMIKNFNNQDYPKERMEWIIIDDGTDKIEDLVKHIPQVKYYYYDTKMTLGRKRNLMHEKTKGDILVYMDDDDYYPNCRVSHAVETLQNSDALCAGSSKVFVYFKHLNKIYSFGPYGPNHSTAGTFAFKRELLKETSYDESASLAEEKTFLKNYTIPFVQLDPYKTILVFSHIHNTFDKKQLLDHPNDYVKETMIDTSEIIKDETIRNFYLNEIEDLLSNYKEGLPEMKPDVLIQLNKMKEDHQNKLQNKHQKIMISDGTREGRELSNYEIVNFIKKQKEIIDKLSLMLKQKDNEIDKLKLSIDINS